MNNPQYITLVFKTETKEEAEIVRGMALNELCQSWMRGNTWLKHELIEKAIEQNDLDKVEKYLYSTDVEQYRHELELTPDEAGCGVMPDGYGGGYECNCGKCV